MPGWPFYCYLLNNAFGEQSDSQTLLRYQRINGKSINHYSKMEVCKSNNRKSSRLYSVFVTFRFMGFPAGRQKNSIIQPTDQSNLNILLVCNVYL